LSQEQRTDLADSRKRSDQNVLARVLAFDLALRRSHVQIGDGANPTTGVKLPKAKPPEDTHAYSLKEETAMMDRSQKRPG
jgi:hypothetical protein